MTGKTHQIIGIGAGLGSYLVYAHPTYGPATLAWVSVISSLGALLPDIDSPAARIWQGLPFFGHIAEEVVNPFLQHRNLTHSFLGFGLVTWGIYTLGLHVPAYWGLSVHRVELAFCLAYASHLLADALTVQGIPLFFPAPRTFGFPPHPFQGLRIETGKWFENFIIFPAVNLLLVALVWYHWSLIKTILFH